jgi:hypothetical protein
MLVPSWNKTNIFTMNFQMVQTIIIFENTSGFNGLFLIIISSTHTFHVKVLYLFHIQIVGQVLSISIECACIVLKTHKL